MKIGYIYNRNDIILKYIKNKKVLDVGCVDARPDGTKKYKTSGLHLFIGNNARSITGLDLDYDGVKELCESGYNVKHGNAECISLDEEFECIVAGEVLEHLSNQGMFLDNMARHLCDDGYLLLTIPNAFSVVSIMRIISKNAIKVHGEHTCWYDPVTIGQLLGRHSYRVEEMFFTNKSKWHDERNIFRLKYYIYKTICKFRSYFSGVIVVVAKKR